MASPNTGLFASSFIDGFLKQKQSQKDRKNKNDIIKLQTKLIEQQLLSGKIKLEARTTVADIMAAAAGGVDDTPAAPPPPDIFSTGLGGDFANPAQNIPGAGIDSLDLPSMMAALMENPEFISAAVQSGQLDLGDFLRGQQGQEPSNIRSLRAVGIDPQSDRGREAILSNLDAGADDNAMAKLMLGLQTEKLAEQKRERDVAEKTESEARIGRRQAVQNDFANARRIIELQQDLAGTAFATGTPYGKFVRNIGAGLNALMDIAGFDVAKAEDLIAKRDELGKLFADGTLEAIDRFKGTGTITNQKFEALVAASPEIGKTAIANAQVLATRMRAVLDAAARKGEIVPNRAEIEAWITEMKSLSATAPAGARNIGDTVQSGFDAATVFAQDTADRARPILNEAAGKARSGFDAASEMAKMTLDQIQDIDFSGMSQSTKKALLEKLESASAVARQGIEAAKPIINQATDFAKLQFNELQQIDINGLTGKLKAKAISRWEQLLSVMPLQQIQQIDGEDIVNWTKEQKAALDKRLTELGIE